MFFFNDTATTEIYTLSLHDALPISVDPQDTSSGIHTSGSSLVSRAAAARPSDCTVTTRTQSAPCPTWAPRRLRTGANDDAVSTRTTRSHRVGGAAAGSTGVPPRQPRRAAAAKTATAAAMTRTTTGQETGRAPRLK